MRLVSGECSSSFALARERKGVAMKSLHDHSGEHTAAGRRLRRLVRRHASPLSIVMAPLSIVMAETVYALKGSAFMNALLRRLYPAKRMPADILRNRPLLGKVSP